MAGISDPRTAWVCKWCDELLDKKVVLVREFAAALGRVAHAAEVLVYLKPFLGPLYAWQANLPPVSMVHLPLMVVMVLSWLREKFAQKLRTPFGLPVTFKGELYRADAKAQGDLVVVGGWELAHSDSPLGCRWFSIRLNKHDIPWAYSRGDPFKAIAALELLGTLLCIMAFQPQEAHPTGWRIAFTASGDNRSTGFALDKLSSTKFPLYLVLMELSEQLRIRNLLLSIAWRPRDENEEADALTNEVFGNFCPERRVHFTWGQLEFLVLPRLTKAAADLFHLVKEAIDRARLEALEDKQSSKLGKKRPLKETDPW